jgi:hypothetical protein
MSVGRSTSALNTPQLRLKMPTKKQGYKARLDERLGMTKGKQATKKMSAAGRRKVSKATRKPKGSYGFKKK